MAVLDTQSPLLTAGEAAAWLRSKERTLERWRAEGTGPAFVKLGRRVAYRHEDLVAWVVQQTRQPIDSAIESKPPVSVIR